MGLNLDYIYTEGKRVIYLADKNKLTGRFEMTFGKSELDETLWTFLLEKSIVVGKTAYLKQLLYNQMNKENIDKKKVE